LLGSVGDACPVFRLPVSVYSFGCRRTYGLEFVVTITDCLHLLVLRVPVKGRVTTKEEIGNDTDSPDIDRLSVTSFLEDLWLKSQ